MTAVEDILHPEKENEEVAKQWLAGYIESIRQKNIKASGRKSEVDENPVYAIYARKSTESDKKQTASIESQIDECTRYAAEHNLTVEAIFQEKKTAFKSDERAVFNDMLDEIKNEKERRFNSILTWSPDRLARNMKEGGEIIDLLDRNIILNLQFPRYYFVNDANGKMTLGIQFVLAKQYSENLSLHTVRGNYNSLLKGKALKSPPYGYDIVSKEDRRIVPDKNSFSLLQVACQKVIEGSSLSKVAEFLNESNFTYRGSIRIFTVKTLSKILVNPILAGIYVSKDRVIDFNQVSDDFVPILSPFQFWKLRERLGDRGKAFQGKKTKIELLRGIVNCEYCGNIMTPSASRSKSQEHYLYLSCFNKRCRRNTENRKGVNKLYKKSIRAKVVFEFMYTIVEKCLNVQKSMYDHYVSTVKNGLVESKITLEKEIHSFDTELGIAKNKIATNLRDLANEEITNSPNMVNYLDTERRKLQIKVVELQAKIKEAKEELAKIELGVSNTVMSWEEFSNTMEKLGFVLRKSRNQARVQTTINMIFSNIVVDTDHVTQFRLKPPFKEYVDMSKFSYGVADGI